jgi:hypothetical protein
MLLLICGAIPGVAAWEAKGRGKSNAIALRDAAIGLAGAGLFCFLILSIQA